jgi:putative transposase
MPDVVYEVTSRTIQQRFLLRPGQTSRELIEGVLARALLIYPAVRLHAYHFMSNHVHMLVSTGHGAALAEFLGYALGNVARELGRLHDWEGRLWARRASVVPVLDDTTVVARLRYVLSQGVKEGLVARPEDWPGASSTRGLLGEQIVGVWIDRDVETRLRKRGKRGGTVDESLFTTRYALRLTPLPCWDEPSIDAQRPRVMRLIEEVVADARATRTQAPLGVQRLLAQDPHARPTDPERNPAPACHASSVVARAAFRRAYRAFCSAFRTVALAVRTGVTASRAAFPPGSFPRPYWFVPGAAPFLSGPPDG